MHRATTNVAWNKIDLAPYAGLWIAVVRNQVSGVGETPRQARQASKYQRPKEEPLIIFVNKAKLKRKT
ncbi:MAG: hypothetical protein HY070_07575 [Chloroflexi bacterium]|nr:hypothetical protein [Chloroflexota bacterium]MBI3742295.1 hypothetical protein [Chloroflexota bacterium]